MKKGLLASVRKYPIGDIDPFENFLTEALCWLLGEYPEHGKLVFGNDVIKGFSFEDLTWKTQQTIKHHKGDGFVDLLGCKDDDCFFIVENKTTTGFHDNQLERYLGYFVKNYPKAKVYVATLTPYFVEDTSEIPEGTIKVRWTEVAYRIQEYLLSLEKNTKEYFVLNDFLELLIEEGLYMSNEPISSQSLKEYFKLSKLESQLNTLFRSTLNRCQTKIMEVNKRLGQSENVRPSIAYHWGRLGIESSNPKNWNPGFFFGVILDPSDHCIRPLDESNGPDLSFIVSINEDFHSCDRESLLKEYVEVFEELKIIMPGWELTTKFIQGKESNKWHPLFFRRSFGTYFDNTTHKSIEAQVDQIEKDLSKILNELLKRPEIKLKLVK